jgi:hypothetical protein
VLWSGEGRCLWMRTGNSTIDDSDSDNDQVRTERG